MKNTVRNIEDKYNMVMDPTGLVLPKKSSVNVWIYGQVKIEEGKTFFQMLDSKEWKEFKISKNKNWFSEVFNQISKIYGTK